MSNTLNLKQNSFLVYGLGSTGHSVIKYFKKNNVNDFFVWDDNINIRKKFKKKNPKNIKKLFDKIDYIVLSPGINIKKLKFKKELKKNKRKIITDLDLLYSSDLKFKSVVITGTNGKSTTCKIIKHLLEKNKFNVAMCGNIGTPVLNVKIKKNQFYIIEASSFQLFHSQFVHPDIAILLNITNDHIDWHGSKSNYIKSKFKIFKLQNKKDYALVKENLKKIYYKNKYNGKLISLYRSQYDIIQTEINNRYLLSGSNRENMVFVYTLAKILKIKKNSFINSMNSFSGLPHRYEIFLKKKNVTFINDSKATSFEATKFALMKDKNIFWIVGGLPKLKDKINIFDFRKNIVKSYIIGKNVFFFKKQLKNLVKISVVKNLENAIKCISKDSKSYKDLNKTILLSPSAASFDQFKNFESRGNEFKRLCRLYARKII